MNSFRSRYAPFVALLCIMVSVLFAANVLNYSSQGGSHQHIGGNITIDSGGTATVASGGNLTAASGSTTNIAGTFKIGGTTVTPTAAQLNESVLTLDIADGSADTTYYLVSPHAGTISKIYTVIDGVVSTADITLTANIGVTGVTNGVVTITQSGSAAGDIDVATPTAANTLTAGQAFNLVVAGGGAGGSPRIHASVVITR